MPEVDGMKYIIFLLATFSFQFVLGVQPFSGFLTKKGDDYFFTPKSSQIFYAVSTASLMIQDGLSRLDSGDFISGNGSLDTTNKKIIIESIDYVGLQKLLGPWVSSDGTVIFKDFSTMRYTPRVRDVRFETRPEDSTPKEFRYSISPTDDDEWAVFLSDETSTTFATMEFKDNKVILKIFESESGKIARTLKLGRP